jgi:transcriptional regulator with GAF, ATPase, and Fis domain
MTVAEEVGRLRKEVSRLSQENERLKEMASGGESSSLVEINLRLMKRVAELEERLNKLEAENLDFANHCVQVQEQNEAITNLYVASHRLHATIDPEEVMTIIFEILVDLVGAEVFGVFMLDEKKKILQLVSGEGLEDKLPSKSLPNGEGVIGEVASTGEPFYFEPKNPSEVEARLPLAAVPLNMNDKPVGVIVIYKLLRQKASFSSIDYQLLHLLAAHAATALVSARLHSDMDRKLKTIEGFVHLMKSQ